MGWLGGAGIFRFPPKLTVSHFQMEVEDFFFARARAVVLNCFYYRSVVTRNCRVLTGKKQGEQK